MINFRKVIHTLGVIDLAYIAWLFLESLKAQKIPIYSNLLHDIEAAGLFGSIYSLFFVFGSHLLSVSILLSGILLIKNNRFGLALALIQSPFRLLLIIPPTFFFVSWLEDYFPTMGYVFIGLVYLMEVLKIATLTYYFKEKPCK